MRGVVEVIQHRPSGGSEVVYRDDNMVVDNAKKTIVNMLTHVPAPSGAVETYKSPDGTIFYLGPNGVAHDNSNTAYFDSSSFLSSTINSGAGKLMNYPPLNYQGNILSDVWWGKSSAAGQVSLEWSSLGGQGEGCLTVSGRATGDTWLGAELVLSSQSCPSGYFYYVQADVRNHSGPIGGSIADKLVKFRQLEPDNTGVSAVSLATSSNAGWATNDWFTVSGIYDFTAPTDGACMAFDFWVYANTSNENYSTYDVDNVIVRRMYTDKPPAIDQIGDYQIKAMTLGSAKQNYNAHDSRYGVEYRYTDTSAQYLEMSGLSSIIFAKGPSVPNFILDETGNKNSHAINAQLRYNEDDVVDLELFPPSQVEGSPEIKDSYTRADGTEVDAFYVNKTKGQDYVIVETKIPTSTRQPISLLLKGESNIPFEVSFLRKRRPNVVFSENYISQEYYNFQTRTFTDRESTQEVKLNVNSESRVDYEPIVDISEGPLAELRTTFVARFVIPRRYLYEKGFVALESIQAVDSSRYSLGNPTFAKKDNYLFNSNFKEYLYLKNSPDYLASSLGLVDFVGWNEINPISNSINPIDQISSLGSVTLYKDLAGEIGAVLQASCLPALNLSAAAAISQDFFIPTTDRDWFSFVGGGVGEGAIYGGGFNAPSMELSLDVYTASAASRGLTLTLRNETVETDYQFRSIAVSGLDRGEWGGGSPLVISENNGNAVSGQFVHVSEIVNLPPSFLDDKFSIKIEADGTNSNELAKYIVKNVNLGRVRDWVYSNQGLNNPTLNESTVMTSPPTMGSGIVFSAVDIVTDSQATDNENLTTITYMGQGFSDIDPKKKYNLLIDAEMQQPSKGASLGLSLWHADYTNGQNGEADVAKLAGTYGGIQEEENTGNLYNGYNIFLNPTAALRRVNSFRGLDVNDPDYHNRYDRAVHFCPLEDIYIPVVGNSKYTFNVNSARQALSGTYDTVAESNISQLRDVACTLVLYSAEGTKFYYNFATKTWLSELPSPYASDVEDYYFIFSKGSDGMGGNFAGQIQELEEVFYTPTASTNSPWAVNEDGTLSVVLEFFTFIHPEEAIEIRDYSSDNIGYQQCYIRDFSIKGDYPTLWSPSNHSSYRSPAGPAPDSAVQPRTLFYAGDGSWTKFGTNTGNGDTFVVSPKAVSGALIEGIPPIDWSLSGNSQICVPVYGMDVLMGNLVNADGTVTYGCSGGATDNSTYMLFLIHNQGCSIQVNKVELVDASLGAYGGPVLSNRDQITTSENVGARVVPNNLVGGWHSHFVSSLEGAPVPRITVRDFSGSQFLEVSGSDTVPYQAPTVAYSQYVSDLGLTSKDISIAVDQWGGTGSDWLFKAFQLYNTQTKERFIWDFISNGWLADNDSFPFSYAKSRSSTKTFKVPDEVGNVTYDRKTYYPGMDWITSGITLPLWKASSPDPRILTVLFRQGPDATGAYYLRNLRFYSNYTEAQVSSVYPEFPSPEDSGIQPEVPNTPGRLGHFLNNIEFFTSANYATGDKTLEDALTDGCYPPAEGILYMSGAGGAVADTPTTLYGNLNRFSVITPNGYILEQQRMPYGKSTLFDSSCGFVMDPAYQVYFSSVAHDTDQYGVFSLTDNLLSVSSADVMGSNGNFEGGYLISGTTDAYTDPNHWINGSFVGRDADVFFSSITSGVNPNTAINANWAYASRAGDSRWSLVLSGDDDGSPANWKGYAYNFNQWTAPSGYHYLAKQDIQFMGGSGLDQTFHIKEQSDSQNDQPLLYLATDTQMEWLENHAPNEFSSVSAVGWYGDIIGRLGSTDGHLQWMNFIYDHGAAGTPENATSSVAAMDNLSLQRCCGPGDEMGQPRVRYAITLSRDEWELLDKKYGGIEAVGLHTMNLVETAKKRGSERGKAIPPYLVSGNAYPFSSTLTWGDLPTKFPTDGTARSGIGEPGGESLNSMCLRAKETPLQATNARNAVRLFHTNFGYPALDPSGWASGTDSVTLAFNYKVVDDLGTPGTPEAYISSPHFGDLELGGTQNVWQSFSKTFSIATSALGENTVTWYFAKDQETSLAGQNEIRLDDVKLTNNTNPPPGGGDIVNYNFAFRHTPNTAAGYYDNAVSAFSTDWHTPNFLELGRTYDGEWYNSSLYNAEQLIENEPVFDLFAKKVFFPGGLKLGDNSDKLTIIWTLYF